LLNCIPMLFCFVCFISCSRVQIIWRAWSIIQGSLGQVTRIQTSTLVLLRCTIHTEQYLSVQVTVTVIQDNITWILHYIPRLYVISDVSGHSHIIIQDINSTRLYLYIYWNFRISCVVKNNIIFSSDSIIMLFQYTMDNLTSFSRHLWNKTIISKSSVFTV
jgi:hypothetical protein